MDSKRGISPVIALVLLIAIGVAASGIVYNGVKNSIVPDEVEVISCPEATDLSIRSVACSTQNNLCLTIANKGKFSPDGYVLSADNRTPKSYDLYTINEDGSVVIPNEEKFINYSFPIEYYEDNVPLGNLDNVTYVQIQPFRYGDSGEKLLCDTVLYQDVVCEDSPIDCAQTCEVDSDCEGSTYCEPLVCRNSQCVVENPILCNEPKVSEPYCGEDGNVYVDTTNFICSNELMNCEQSGPIPLIQGDPCEFGCDLGKCVVPTDETLDVMFIIPKGLTGQDRVDTISALQNFSLFLNPSEHNTRIGLISFGIGAFAFNYDNSKLEKRHYYGIPPILDKGRLFTEETLEMRSSFTAYQLFGDYEKSDIAEALYLAKNRLEVYGENQDREDMVSPDIVVVISHHNPDMARYFSSNTEWYDPADKYCDKFDLDCHSQQTIFRATELKESGAEIYSISIENDQLTRSDLLLSTMEGIASSSENYAHLDDFSELDEQLILFFKSKD